MEKLEVRTIWVGNYSYWCSIDSWRTRLANVWLHTVNPIIDLFCLCSSLSTFIDCNATPNYQLDSDSSFFPPSEIMPLEAVCCSHQGQPHSASQYVNNGGDSFSLLSWHFSLPGRWFIWELSSHNLYLRCAVLHSLKMHFIIHHKNHYTFPTFTARTARYGAKIQFTCWLMR